MDFDGEVLWDIQCSGTFPHTPTIGDVDGDGVLDVVAVAAAADGSSHLWVVRGDTGKPLPGYPKTLPTGTLRAPARVPIISSFRKSSLSHYHNDLINKFT